MSRLDAVPKYLLLSQELEARIRAGDWAAGKVPTVRDIAARHDVSIVTASRALQVLRDKGLVHTIERSGCYLAQRTPQRWALCLRITPGPFQQASTAVNSIGFDAVARQAEADFVSDAFNLRDDVSDEDLDRQVRDAVEAGLGGLFLLPSRVSEVAMQLDERLLYACRANGLPVVLVERNLRGVDRPLEYDLVCSDDVEGGRVCTRHLVEEGRCRIAFVIGSPTSSHRDRLAGYLCALHAAASSAAPLVLEQPADVPTKEAYARLADRLLKHRADGVVCYQDYTAIGIILELLRRGLAVPRDMAVAGFDNLPIGDTFSVGVTTYAFPSEKVAARALRVMAERIKFPDDPPVKVVIPGHLIVRDSSVAAKRKPGYGEKFMIEGADVAVIGGGIVGLAQAWSAAKRGLSVVLFERGPRAEGASIRNFGMIWPIGLPAGPLRDAALRGRELWTEITAAAGIWHDPCGSLHLAYAPDELAVLTEFAERAPARGYECTLMDTDALRRLSPAVNGESLLGGLWSPTEMTIDPRQAIATIPRWLHERFGVRLHFGTTIQRIDMPHVESTDGQRWRVERALVCGGVDFHTLFPEVFSRAGLRRCKLQMMRIAPQPNNWRMGPMIAGGLTLRHYATFADCPSVVKLRQRIAAESPELDRLGIHVMAAQNGLGEVVIGDSHEYDDAIEPFDKSTIDEMILQYLRRMVRLPEERIAARWHGIYAKHATLAEFTAEPQAGVLIVVNTCGLGMTLSFGLAERRWENTVG